MLKVVRESEENQIPHNDTVSEMEEICKKHGYALYYAYNNQFKKDGKLYITVSIIDPENKRLRPGVFGPSCDAKVEYKVQTSSYGSLKESEYEEYVGYCQDALAMIKELSKVDHSKLPIVTDYE